MNVPLLAAVGEVARKGVVDGTLAARMAHPGESFYAFPEISFSWEANPIK